MHVHRYAELKDSKQTFPVRKVVSMSQGLPCRRGMSTKKEKRCEEVKREERRQEALQATRASLFRKTMYQASA